MKYQEGESKKRGRANENPNFKQSPSDLDMVALLHKNSSSNNDSTIGNDNLSSYRRHPKDGGGSSDSFEYVNENENS